MKSIKKMLALVIAGVMVLGMSTMAFADAPTSVATVSITDGTGVYVAERTFKAYKVFAANWEGGLVTNIEAGDGIDWASVDFSAVEGLESVTDAASLAEALSYDADADATVKAAKLALAEKAAKVLKDAVIPAKAVTVTDGGTLANGYWIIIDETELGNDDVANAALLQVSGDTVTIAVKTSKTQIEKKIDGDTDLDTESTGLVDHNNGQIGDLVPYVITSTVPDTTYFDKYYMEFCDTVSSGLDVSAKDATGEAAFSNYKVYIDDVEKTEAEGNYTLTVDTSNRKVNVVFNDVKGLDGKVLKLTYKAKINSDAIVGESGNPNEVTLKYTNSPDHSGDGEYKTNFSETPKDVVITYLTGIELLKVDATDTTKTLAGAEFTIEGTRAVSTIVTTDGFAVSTTVAAEDAYYLLKNGSYTKTAPTVQNQSDYDTDHINDKYEKTVTTETKTETNQVKVSGITGADGILKFDDLGAGTYTINEITAPTGYNILEAPIVVKVEYEGPETVATGEETCTWTPSIVSGADSVTFSDGVAKITVENNGGTTLPSTGGIGTTIFYVAGTVLLLGAAILLVSKRRAA